MTKGTKPGKYIGPENNELRADCCMAVIIEVDTRFYTIFRETKSLNVVGFDARQEFN